MPRPQVTLLSALLIGTTKRTHRTASGRRMAADSERAVSARRLARDHNRQPSVHAKLVEQRAVNHAEPR